MSDFKIIKCKKCDAALVEMSGQKLTRCVQCGYEFSESRGKTSKRAKQKLQNIQPHMSARPAATQKTINITKGTADIRDIIGKLKNLKNSVATTPTTPKSETKKPKVLPKKKKGFPIGTIIFWIILFNVLRNIFRM